MALVQLGKTPAKESNCAFLLAYGTGNHGNQATTHSIQPQLASAQQQAMCSRGYNSFFVCGKQRKLSR